MREGPICPCPECRKGDIIALDKQLYTCTHCHRPWDLEEMYKTLWFDKLQKLIERRQSIKKPSSLSAKHLDMRIEQTKESIMDFEHLLETLGEKLSIMDLDHDDPEYKLLEVRFEDTQRHLKLCHRRLKKYIQMRDELTIEDSN